MNKLEESLHIPEIGGKMIASYERHRDLSRQNEISFSWYVQFTIPGPDSRYDPGQAKVSAKDIKEIIKALEIGLSKITSLKAQSFSGEFSKRLYGLYNPVIELKAKNRIIWIDISVSSRSFIFSRTLTPDNIALTIKKLEFALQKEMQMIETLKSLI